MKRDISDVSNNLFIQWCDNVDQYVYRFLIGSDPERLITTQSYTVSDSPETETLPSDFKDIQGWGCGIYKMDDNSEPTTDRLSRTGYGSTQRGYYITGTSLIFTGIESSETYTMRYVPIQATHDDLSDDLLLPEEYTDYYIKAVDVLYNIWDEEVGMESFADARYVRTLDELALTIRKEPPVYGLSNFSATF